MNFHLRHVYCVLFLQKWIDFPFSNWMCLFQVILHVIYQHFGASCLDFLPEDLKQSKPHSHWFSVQEDELFISKSVDFSMISMFFKMIGFIHLE